jgi:hypothetical protein
LVTRPNLTANGATITLPADAMIAGALFQESNGFAVAVSIGTTNGGSDIVQPATVPANGTLSAPAASFTKLNLGAAGPLYISSTNWNGAKISVKLWFFQ